MSLEPKAQKEPEEEPALTLPTSRQAGEGDRGVEGDLAAPTPDPSGLWSPPTHQAVCMIYLALSAPKAARATGMFSLNLTQGLARSRCTGNPSSVSKQPEDYKMSLSFSDEETRPRRC